MDKEKKIDIGTSSLVDLKAELHRKQQESRNLRRAAADRPAGTSKSKVWSKTATASAKAAACSKTNPGVEQRDQRDREEVERETKDLDRSRTVLEAKARVYDRLRTGTEALEDDATNERFLVNFQQKAIDDVTRRRQRRQAAAEESSAEPPPPRAAADEEWVEYTDSLGRSRTVMRRDLEEYQRRDLESRRTTDDATQPEMMSEDLRREQQRQIWEKQELENAAKRDIHYQDVLFNEARAHGAGYFAFSQDAEERARQRAELDELRDRTEDQQARAETTRKRKSQLLQERLRKVRERKRLRLGLPIADRLDEPDAPEESEETEADRPDPAPAATLTEEQIAARLEEERREHERRAFVRDWDVGKLGVAKKTVMTQEEWVEQQRKDRPAEFAPPTQYEPRGAGRGRGHRRAPASAAEGPAGEDRGQRAPAAAQTSAGATQSTEGIKQTTANMQQPPSNLEQSYSSVPPPNAVQTPPNMACPPPNMTQPPPNMGHLPADMGRPPLNMSQPPPNLAHPPPGMSHPRPAAAGPVGQFPLFASHHAHARTAAEPGAAQPGAAPSRAARVASYRARQAAAADLTDPDCLPPGEEEEASTRGAGTEVAPPPTAEYYGGDRRGRRQPAPVRPDVGSAIEAGLALLSQDSKQKNSKTFDL